MQSDEANVIRWGLENLQQLEEHNSDLALFVKLIKKKIEEKVAANGLPQVKPQSQNQVLQNG